MIRHPPRPPLFPSPPLSRSPPADPPKAQRLASDVLSVPDKAWVFSFEGSAANDKAKAECDERFKSDAADRKSTRLNSSHSQISYAVFCLKKKKNKISRSRCDSIMQTIIRKAEGAGCHSKLLQWFVLYERHSYLLKDIEI